MTELPHPLPDALVELIARRFKLLGEPMRIKLLDQLRKEPATVGELVEVTGASQQNVSKHLGVLLDAGLVSRTRDGNFARYAIADPILFDLCELVSDDLRRRLADLDSILGEGLER
jgi:DNA-binding transcriptional ArsR family regulator